MSRVARPLRCALVLCASLALLCVARVAWAAGPVLTTEGGSFLVDGTRTFLSGVSLFDALGPVPPRDEDLDAIKGWGIRAVRVWAHWREPIYARDGALTPAGRTRLLALCQRLSDRGLILELVLLRPGQLPGQRYVAFDGPASRLRAVEAIARELRAFRNAIFDLYNEHDHGHGRISHREARALRDAVKRIDAGRLVTISSTGGHLVTADGRVGAAQAKNLAGEVARGTGSVAVDVVAPHFVRTADWAEATGPRLAALRRALDALDVRVPILLNEERRATGAKPLPPEDYRRAYTQAVSGGAAGWLFHTDAGFALGTRAFLDALTAPERSAIETLVKP